MAKPNPRLVETDPPIISNTLAKARAVMSDLPQPYGPEAHRSAARQLGIRYNSAKELIVLTRDNDPFYSGAPSNQLHAEWFAEMLDRFGLGVGAHIRRVHYRMISAREPIKLPEGEPYRNTETHWARLVDASRHARILGLVDVESMVDRRNDPAVEYVLPPQEPFESPEISPGEASFWLPTLELEGVVGELSTPTPAGYDYDDGDQPVMIELWVEKSTMADILDPLCQELRVNYLEGIGFESITRTVEFLRRAQRYGRAAHLLYVSDFDDAGDGMPVAVARQLQFWLDRLGIEVEVSVDALVLTRDQCVKYELPRTPAKTGGKRKSSFKARYGEGVTELDALEALHPGELEGIIREAVAPFRDPELPNRLDRTRWEAQQILDDAWQDAGGDQLQEQMQELLDQADAIAAEQAERIHQIMEETRQRLQPFADDAAELDRQAREMSESLDVELPERPEPEIIGPATDVLFDSRRHWLDQLTAFKARQNGGL